MPGQRPPGGSLAPKTKVTVTSRPSSQMGQTSLVARPDVAGGPEQLGVGVADVGLQDLAPLDRLDHPVADDPVLHLGRDVRAHGTGW